MIGRPPSNRPRRSRAIKVLVTDEEHAAIARAVEREDCSASDMGRAMFDLLTDDDIVRAAKKAGMSAITWVRGRAKP